MAPASYKAKIANGTEAKFKFLRTVAGWTMQGIKLAHLELLDLPKPYLTIDMINYVRQVYRPLVQVYYYGETKIPKLIKEIYTDEASYPDAPQEKLSSLAKEAITQWLYIQNEVIKKHISVSVTAFYDNGLTGYDYTVGSGSGDDFTYMIMQDEVILFVI